MTRLAMMRAANRTLGGRRHASSLLDGFYRTALKSNISHVTFVVTGAIIFEVIYGKATDTIWNSVNDGKLPHQIDWSAFREDDDEEDDED
ncbi:hypothetical protein CTAYLR_003157 [Chrysophaeum taylorii]|uniref:Cytochrome b-c1 complex subunit 9 n=1 Tax=Chrysophaeum taylorii TaxID=2483200 RepID=A0AAD7XQE9_9STRA|nr:hypothetical protein CTAYLR_003157 [Chrysophaeum taylorii]